jgi:hypothetical protein
MTVGARRAAEALAAEQQLAAAVEGVADVALHLVDRRLLDQRAHFRLRLQPVADLELRCRIDEERDEVRVDAVLDVDPVRGDARLAAVPELADHGARDRRLEIGVVEDDERGVPPSSSETFLI